MAPFFSFMKKHVFSALELVMCTVTLHHRKHYMRYNSMFVTLSHHSLLTLLCTCWLMTSVNFSGHLICSYNVLMHTISLYCTLSCGWWVLCRLYMCVHVKSNSLQKISDNFVYYVTVHGWMLSTIHTALKRAAPLAELAIMMCSQVNESNVMVRLTRLYVCQSEYKKTCT